MVSGTAARLDALTHLASASHVKFCKAQRLTPSSSGTTRTRRDTRFFTTATNNRNPFSGHCLGCCGANRSGGMVLSENKPENEVGTSEAKLEQSRFGAIAFAVTSALLIALIVALLYIATALP